MPSLSWPLVKQAKLLIVKPQIYSLNIALGVKMTAWAALQWTFFHKIKLRQPEGRKDTDN